MHFKINCKCNIYLAFCGNVSWSCQNWTAIGFYKESNASGNTAVNIANSGGSATDKFTRPVTLEVLKSDFLGFSSAVSVEIDGNSYEAARFSGEVQIESSSGFTTSNDGGSTTVSSAQDAFKDGFLSISSSSTGEIKTISPIVLDGDISSGHPDGLSASSSILSYGLNIPDTENGCDFPTTVDFSKSENLSKFAVAKKIADGIRSDSPSIELLGNSLSSIAADGTSFQINHDSLTYTLTMENGEVQVSGGEKDRLTAYFENPDKLTFNTTSLKYLYHLSENE